MDDNLVNADLILNWVQKQVESRHPIDPGLWIDISVKLNILKSDEDDKVAELSQKIAKKKVEYLKEDKNVSRANLMVEASDDYRELLKQKAKIERIEETIRLSKVQAKLASESYKN